MLIMVEAHMPMIVKKAALNTRVVFASPAKYRLPTRNVHMKRLISRGEG